MTSAIQCAIDFIDRFPKFKGQTRLLLALASLRPYTFVRSVYGPWMIARPEDFTNRSAIVGSYGTDIADELSLLRKGDLFIDIGANVGIWSLVASKYVGDEGIVIAFEPQQNLLAELLLNALHNGCPNITGLGLAVAHSSGQVSLRSKSTEHTGLAHIDTTRIGNTLAVDLRSELPLLVQLAQRRSVTIKIDTEGAELDVLHGLAPLLAMNSTLRIITEINDAHLARFGHTREDLYAILELHGFAPRKSRVERSTSEHYDEIFRRVRQV